MWIGLGVVASARFPVTGFRSVDLYLFLSKVVVMKHLLAIFLILLVSCETGRQQPYVLAPAEFQHQLQTTTDAVLVDVRRPDELAAGQIAGARNVVFGSATFEQDILQLEKKPVFIYCAAGVRSAKAAVLLRENGYVVYELEGGLQNWVASGLPVTTP